MNMPESLHFKLLFVSLGFLFIVSLFYIIDGKIDRLNFYKKCITIGHQMKDNVNGANQAIRTAAIITSKEHRELELEKRMLTRKSSTEIFEFLTKPGTLTPDEHVFIKTIIDERPIYRDAQNKVVAAVLKFDPYEISQSFIPYIQLQEKYNARCDSFILYMHKKADATQKQIGRFTIILLIITNSFTFLTYLLFKK